MDILLLAVLLVSMSPVKTECNHTNPDAFICLHVFLERDFPLIEEMLNRPNFIREGREFEDMCRSVLFLKILLS